MVSTAQSFRSQRTWQRIKKGFWMGKCVLTLGTPQKLPERQEYDLIPSHSYAVIDLLEGDDGGRHVVLANPWRTSPAASTAESPPESATAGEPQTMRLDWDILPVYFDAIHINWDPATFDHSQTVHLNVDGPSQPTTSTKNRHSRRLRLNVQQRTSKPSEIWLLLARHSSCLVEKDEFMSLQVNALSTASGQATEEQAPAGAEASSMTDDPFELYRFLPEEGATTFDINVLHEGPSPVFGFSLTALSDHRLELHDGPPALPYHKEVSGAWTAATAGGNHTCASFYRNPQYSVKLSTPPRTEQKEQRLEIEAETDRAAFEGRDVLAGKSTYNYGRDAATREGLDPGTYTLVVSSYQPGHLGSFKLSIRSSMPLNVTSIPAEGAGLFSRKFEGAWTPGQAGGSVRPLENPRVRLRLSGPGQVRVRLQTPEKPLPVAVTICSLNEAGSLTRVVGTSGPHVDYPGGTVIRGLQLTEADHDYVIIPSTQRPEEHVPFTLLVYADVRFELVPL
ncbi:cysteine protease [Rhodotorula sphaerocarpa]